MFVMHFHEEPGVLDGRSKLRRYGTQGHNIALVKIVGFLVLNHQGADLDRTSVDRDNQQ